MVTQEKYWVLEVNIALDVISHASIKGTGLAGQGRRGVMNNALGFQVRKQDSEIFKRSRTESFRGLVWHGVPLMYFTYVTCPTHLVPPYHKSMMTEEHCLPGGYLGAAKNS
ncbi:hypothetical protein CDAR_246961 [Caerostris darwini]|uniref:Uncharacterized protein n=1 Tax=Caerostris darwini TaxID=1538125 RepID=A0AAV4WW94_9ARAC|nr:hypothetical protein CDAR_246961 [Caerostris darwini]